MVAWCRRSWGWDVRGRGLHTDTRRCLEFNSPLSSSSTPSCYIDQGLPTQPRDGLGDNVQTEDLGVKGALEKRQRCLGILDILPRKPTNLVLYLESSVIHPVVTILLVGQGKGGKEVPEGHVPSCVRGREDKGVGFVLALSLFALDVVETPRPCHDGRGVYLLVVLTLVLLKVALLFFL